MPVEISFRCADNTSYLRLTLTEVQRERFPGVRLQVTVVDDGFTARTKAWVGREELLGFLGVVEACERTRAGAARLVCMSPDELDLRLEQSDAIGHFAVRYEVTAYKDSGVRQSLAGVFPLDSERFGQLVGDLRDFAHDAFAQTPESGTSE